MAVSRAELQELADQILERFGVRMRSGQMVVHYNDGLVRRVETRTHHWLHQRKRALAVRRVAGAARRRANGSMPKRAWRAESVRHVVTAERRVVCNSRAPGKDHASCSPFWQTLQSASKSSRHVLASCKRLRPMRRRNNSPSRLSRRRVRAKSHQASPQYVQAAARCCSAPLRCVSGQGRSW